MEEGYGESTTEEGKGPRGGLAVTLATLGGAVRCRQHLVLAITELTP